MNKTLTDAWAEAERTGESVDIGDIVVCDICYADHTHSDAQGGFLFASKGVCPVCAPRFEGEIHACGEGRYIRARAEPGESFKAFVIRIRAGNNTIKIRPLPFMTHTYVVLEVSQSAYDEIKAKLTEAGYEHAFIEHLIDMHGIALKPPDIPTPEYFGVHPWA